MSFAMHNAAREGKLTELTSLLAQGSVISTRDKHSRTPLHLSAWAGHLECCKVLVAHGADKNAAAMDDTTALHFAAQKGHPEVVRFLLNEGASVNGKTRKGMTALMFGAQSGNAELVKLLITRMADAGSKNKSGKSALDLARDPAIKEILTEAILAAAQPQEDPLRPDTSGAEQPSLPDSMQKSVDSTTAANAEIGPPERPLQEPSEGVTGANVEIGPPERPNTSVHTSNMPFSDNSQQTADEPHTHKRTKPDVGHDLNSKSEDHRPGKVQKVALSFVEDDDDEG